MRSLIASSASSNVSTRSKRNHLDTVTQTSSKAKHIRSDMSDEDSNNSLSNMPPLKDVDNDDDSDDVENSLSLRAKATACVQLHVGELSDMCTQCAKA